MSRTYTTLLGWLLAVVLVAGVATFGVAAAEFEGDRPTSAEAGSELELDVTLTEPFAVGDEWTMAVSTELDDARLQITPRDGAGMPIEGKVVDEVDPGIVTVEIDDSSISTIDFSVRGDVPLIDSARYSYEDRGLENVTALEVQEQFNGAIRGIENGLVEVHRFTEDSRNARQAIDAASVAVDDADSDDARDRLDDAIDLYNNADFDNAITVAEDAEDIADNDEDGEDGGDGILGLAAVGGGGLLLVVLGIYVLASRSRGSNDSKQSVTRGSESRGSGTRTTKSRNQSGGDGRGTGRRRSQSDISDEYDKTETRARQSPERFDDRTDKINERMRRDPKDGPTQVPASIQAIPPVSLTYDGVQKGQAIGKGGNADVYYATAETDYGRITLALKEPRLDGTLHTETVKRMMEEAETWQKLDDHDHIVGVIDYDSAPLPWIVMEYIDAGHLGERAGAMPFEQALWTARATTEAVWHAHQRGVAHLDLKPENILFRSVEDAWDAPKIADWGLSKHLLNHSKSMEGLSTHYAAPEQFDSDQYGSVDHVTDVYQLGAVFYELFTGRPPFEGKPFEVMNRIQREDPTPPSQVADVPEQLDGTLLTALATEKGDRHETVVYLRDELQTLWTEQVGKG